jgi:hypothetical protein
VGDLQTGLDLVLGPTPQRVLVLDRQHPGKAALIEGVHHGPPVHLPQPRHPVTPPAHIPGIRPLYRPARPAKAVPALGEDLDVLGLRVGDLIDIRPQGRDRVDAHPDQVGGVVVQVQAQREQPLPQLRRIGEVAGIAVGVPALHHAVLDDQLDPALTGVVDQGLEQLLGLLEVVGHRPGRVAADKGSHGGAAEGGGGVDAGQHVVVDRLALLRVGVEVVVVVAQ